MIRHENTFSQRSDAYSAARPRYPQPLFEWIAENCPAREDAWDCATGNGQAAIGLSPFFGRVQATDMSVEQIEHAVKAPNIRYSVQGAEDTSFAPGAFDLVTVAQALHWFHYGVFWREVVRVAKPGALFCAWGYAWFDCDPEIESKLVSPLRKIVEPFWASNNKLLWDGYRDKDIQFPFQRLSTPEFSIVVSWTVLDLIAYMQTWSSYKRALLDETAAAGLARLIDRASRLFPADDIYEVRMPLAIAAGRISSPRGSRSQVEP